MIENKKFMNLTILGTIMVFTIVAIELYILPSRINNTCSLQPREEKHNKIEANFDPFEFLNQNIRDFKDWGTRVDKTYTHSYQNMYGQLLGPFRDKKINFLEIGLGCGIHGEGPGQSLKLWRKYLPQANISMFEFDEKCALEFKSQVENLFVGDSGDLKLLQSIGQNYGPFDFVVDDGGHTRVSQINGLVGFWPHMKSKGVYVIEDIYLSTREDVSKSSLDLIFPILELFNDIRRNRNQDNIPIEKYANDIVRDLLSIHCYSHACAFIKK